MDTEMETEQIYQVDVGNLLAFNPNHRFPSAPSSRFVLSRLILSLCWVLRWRRLDYIFV